MFERKVFCTSCYNVEKPRWATRGSFIMEVFLWCFFIIPGLFYSMWRLGSRYKACKKCGCAEVTPLDSPRAIQYLKTIEVKNDESKEPETNNSDIDLLKAM